MRKILITGASGCIGHYVTEALTADPSVELFLFVRDPRKVRLDPRWRSGVTVVSGDLREIARFADLLKTINVAILAATAWGPPEAHDINVVRTLQLLHLLDPRVCEQVLYFSTASIFNRENRPLAQAGQFGTHYIRAKFEALRRLPEVPVAERITVLAPTLVFGGDAEKPHSFLSIDAPAFIKYVNLARFLSIDGSFHFIHARDVAQVVRHLVNHPGLGGGLRTIVLGQEALTFNQAVQQICDALDKRIYFRIPIPASWLIRVAPLFQRHLPAEEAAWGAFCLRYRHFTHLDPVNPATFGLPSYYPTLVGAQQITGSLRGRVIPGVSSQHSQP